MARSISNSSSTGNGEVVYFNPPVQFVTAQVSTPSGSTAAGSFLVEGSIDGANWTTVIGASTFATTRIVSAGSSTSNLYSALRAQLSAHSAGAPVTVNILGR